MGHLTRLSGDYWRFWAATAVSNLGDGIRWVALPLVAVTLTRDPLLIAGIGALMFVPWLVIGPFSGAIVDRVDRRKLIVGVQLCRAAVAVAFAASVAAGGVTIWWLYATALAIAVGETLADSAAQAAVPRLVGPDQLELANGRIVGAQIVTNEIAGAPIGGLLFAVAMALPFAVDASTYLIGAVLVWFVRVDLSPAPSETVDTAPGRLRREVAEGFRYTFTQPLLRGIAVSAAGSNFGSSAGGAVLVLLAVDVLELSEVGFGVLLGIGAVGGVVGASLASRVSLAIGRGRTLFAGMALGGIAMATLGLAPHPVVAGAALFVSSATVAAYNVVNQSLRQAITPPRLLGRVITSVRFVGLGAVPVGALTGGALARVAGVRSPYLLAAGSAWLAAAVIARTLSDDAITAGLTEAAARDDAPQQGPQVGTDRASD